MTCGSFIPVMTARAPADDRRFPIPCGPSTDQGHHVTANLEALPVTYLACRPNFGIDFPMLAAVSAWSVHAGPRRRRT